MSAYIYTLGDIKKNIFRALDEYSLNGSPVSTDSGAAADIEKKLIPAINAAMRRVAFSLVRCTKTAEILFSFPETINTVSDFALAKGQSETLNLKDAASYFLEALGSGCLRIYEGDTLIQSIDILSDYGTVKEYKGFLPDSEDIGLVFSATGNLEIMNLTVYKGSGAAGDYPELYPYLISSGKELFCPLPDNCFGIKRVVDRNGNEVPSELFSVRENMISTDRKNAGRYLFEYYCYPQPFAESSSDSTVVELSPLACDALIYLAAAECCSNDNNALYSKLIYRYQDIAANYFDSGFGKSVSRNGFFRFKNRRKAFGKGFMRG